MSRSATDIANELLAENAALTAENVAMKTTFSAVMQGFTDESYDEGYYSATLYQDVVLKSRIVLKETPATDAAANALRAEGIQMLLNKYAPHTIASSEASEFARQLREGK